LEEIGSLGLPALSVAFITANIIRNHYVALPELQETATACGDMGQESPLAGYEEAFTNKRILG